MGMIGTTEDERDAISIDKEDIPYSFEMEFGGEMYTFTVKYNSLADWFTLDVALLDDPIVYGVPLAYGVDVFASYPDDRLKPIRLKAYDVAGKETRITYDNMNETVFLFVMDGEGDG